MRPPVPRNIPGPISKSKSEKVKFIDDGTVAVSINLKTSLIPDPEERLRPLNYNERPAIYYLTKIISCIITSETRRTL